MAQTTVVWRKPAWQRWTLGLLATAIDAGMIAVLIGGSATAWQPWFFLVVLTLGTMAWCLPMSALDDTKIRTRTMLGSTRVVMLRDVLDVGYGGAGVWVQPKAGEHGSLPRPLILPVVAGVRPAAIGPVRTTGQPAGHDAVDVIRAAADAAGATLAPAIAKPRLPRSRDDRR